MAEFSIAGRTLRLRPIAPDDAPRLVAGLERLTDETRFARFFFVKRGFSPQELDHLTRCDGINHVALVVELAEEAGRPLVAVGRWIRDAAEPAVASIAFLTADRWQGRGIGARLVRQLAREAVARGVTHFRAEVLWGNSGAITLLERIGVREAECMLGSGASELVYRIDAGAIAAEADAPDAPDAPDSPDPAG